MILRSLILCVALVLLCQPFSAYANQTKLPIIVYHEINNDEGEPGTEISISLNRFTEEMQYLHDQGYKTLNMDEVIDFIHGKAFPDKVVAIHFDDGWKSSEAAFPVLEKFGFKSTFWIIADVDNKRLRTTHMKWDEILALANKPYIDIGSHTMTHPWEEGSTLVDWVNGKTPDKALQDAQWEIDESKHLLEEKLGRSVKYLAWPGGHYNDTLVKMAEEAGYEALLTIDYGFNYPGSNPMYIKRNMVHGNCSLDIFEQMMQDGINRNCDIP